MQEESPRKMVRVENKRKNRENKIKKQKVRLEGRKQATHRVKDSTETDDIFVEEVGEDVEMTDTVEKTKVCGQDF